MNFLSTLFKVVFTEVFSVVLVSEFLPPGQLFRVKHAFYREVVSDLDVLVKVQEPAAFERLSWFFSILINIK